MRAATWALENNCAVVIANGEFKDANIIKDIVYGRRIGTFFTLAEKVGASIEDQAAKGSTCHMFPCYLVKIVVFCILASLTRSW